MRSLILLLAGVGTAFSQHLSVGLKGGVPMTDFLNSVSSGTSVFSSKTQRYIVGPTVELRLPAGFGVELDALYRHFSYNSTASLVDVFTNNRTTGNAWEFPLLLKYRFPGPLVRPFVDAGVAFDTLSGLKQTVTRTIFPSRTTNTTTTSDPSELNKKSTVGFVMGVGLDIHALVIHLSPEIRYTRWGTEHFKLPNGSFLSNQNQAEFLVGIKF